jgi:hypothetical protein
MLLVLRLGPLALYWQLVGGYVLGEYVTVETIGAIPELNLRLVGHIDTKQS